MYNLSSLTTFHKPQYSPHLTPIHFNEYDGTQSSYPDPFNEHTIFHSINSIIFSQLFGEPISCDAGFVSSIFKL